MYFDGSCFHYITTHSMCIFPVLALYSGIATEPEFKAMASNDPDLKDLFKEVGGKLVVMSNHFT